MQQITVSFSCFVLIESGDEAKKIPKKTAKSEKYVQYFPWNISNISFSFNV